MEDRLLILPEVSEMLRTPPETLRYWRKQGIGPQAFKVGRRLVYRAADVTAWLDEQARKAG
jgi:DNA-binding transcriptional MerR regulator